MNARNLIFYITQSLFIFFLFLLGLFLTLSHASTNFRMGVISLIEEKNRLLMQVSVLIYIVTIFLFFLFVKEGGRTFLRFKTSEYSVSSDIVRKAVLDFWRGTFPENSLPKEIRCCRKKIEVNLGEIRDDLVDVEEQLRLFLYNRLGYKQKVIIYFNH